MAEHASRSARHQVRARRLVPGGRRDRPRLQRLVRGAGLGGQPPGPWESASGAPPDTYDTGYSATATGFRVNRFRVWLQATPGSDFVVTATSPGGAWSGSVATASGWSAWVNVPATVTDGKGIWALSIDRAAGSSVSQPALLPDPAGGPRNSVDEPYVSPYGNEYEGVLGVEVDGVELTSVVVTASTSVSIGDCDAAGRRPTTLTVDFTPPVPVGWSYSVTWATTLAPPQPSASGTVTGTPLASLSRTVDYLPGTVHPSAFVVLTPPGGPTTTTPLTFSTGTNPGVVVPVCGGDPVCHDLQVASSRPTLCVDASGTTGQVTFTATTTPTSPAWTGPFSWTVRDQSGVLVPLPAPSPTGPALTTAFTSPGRYTVTAAIVRPAGCDPVVVSAPLLVDVADCRCPTVTGGLHATRVDGCELSFSAQVTPAPSGGPITYEWDFGDGTTSTAPPPVSHRYAAGTSGTRTVTLTVRGQAGCEHVEPVTVTVDCGSSTCPSFSGGVTATRVGTSCDFTVAVTTSPASAASQVTWSLPGGGTATGPTATVTGLAPGQSGTATATIPAGAGCPAVSTSTTVTCPGSTPPPTIPACAILLVLALVLLLLGGIVTVVGVCAAVPWVVVVGAAIGVVGLILFIIWALLCAASTPCSLMRTLHCMLFWIVAVVVPVVTIILLIVSGLPCAIATAVTGVAWGSIYAWLGFIMRRVGCTPTC